jgi:Fic family protein
MKKLVSCVAKIRRNSVAHQFDLLHNIGTAEMEKEIMKRVFNITKNMSVEISEKSGIEPSPEEEEINDYLAEVIKEMRQTKK